MGLQLVVSASLHVFPNSYFLLHLSSDQSLTKFLRLNQKIEMLRIISLFFVCVCVCVCVCVNQSCREAKTSIIQYDCDECIDQKRRCERLARTKCVNHLKSEISFSNSYEFSSYLTENTTAYSS